MTDFEFILAFMAVLLGGGFSPNLRSAISMTLFFIPLVTLLLSRSARLDIAAMLVLIGHYVAFKFV